MKKVILLLLMFSFIGVNATPRELDVKKDSPNSIYKSIDTPVSTALLMNDSTKKFVSLSMDTYNNGSKISIIETDGVSEARKMPISVMLPKYTDEYIKEIEDSWLTHFNTEAKTNAKTNAINNVFDEYHRSIEKEKKKIIQKRLNDLGFNINLDAEIQNGLTRFSKITSPNETTVYFDSGNGDLKRIVTFKIKQIPFDSLNRSFGFEETYY